MLEAVDRRLLGKHVLDALLLRGVVHVDLGPVIEVEVVALLLGFFMKKKVSFFLFFVGRFEKEKKQERKKEKNFSLPRPSSAGSPVP